MLHSPDLDFSFSGLKTAVLYEIRKTDENATMKPEKNLAGDVPSHGLSETMKKEIAREFEDAVTEVLVKKTTKAIEKCGAQSLVAGGGVIANKNIRAALEKLAQENSISLFLPPAGVSGDNALMIALAGSLMPEKNHGDDTPIKASGNLSF
jgi:N6-L-threonylcarbamoyladenine synthase